eukprot:5667663-Pleurochrysis_carterae.AAC.1
MYTMMCIIFVLPLESAISLKMLITVTAAGQAQVDKSIQGGHAFIRCVYNRADQDKDISLWR